MLLPPDGPIPPSSTVPFLILLPELERNQDQRDSANDPTSIMWPVYEGSNFLPSNGDNTTCTLGGYPSYVVNASTLAHIQLAVKFAPENGIRLVVNNSGNDYLGKSAGGGALSIWTHRLKDMQYLEDYQNKRYRGTALKMGAGVAAEELYRMAKKVGCTPVSVGGEGHVSHFSPSSAGLR